MIERGTCQGKVNLALEKKRREVDVAKAKELVEVEKKAWKKAIEVYKASTYFMIVKA